ncbi:MAG: ATP-binding protein, partial [Novosphingobium sp.]
QSNLEELERMRAIINDMLFLARADAGDIAGNLVLVDLAEESKRTIEFMDVLFEEAGTEVVLEGGAQGRIEPSLIGRALSNLLDNALRHGNPGAKVIVSIEDKPESVAVSVVNSGKPIAPDALPRIFDRFYCADPSRQSDGRSHGLGLAIVKAVARMHGGTVHAFNRDGTVSVGFELPKQATAAETHAPRARKIAWKNPGVQTRPNIA